MSDDRAALLERIARLEGQVANLRRVVVGDWVYQAAINTPLVGSYVWKVNTDEVWWSDELYGILGYDRSKQEPTTDAFMARVHPDDLPGMNNRLEVIRQTGMRTWHTVGRLVRLNGDVRMCSMTGSVVVGSDGEPLQTIGTVVDYSDEVDIEITSEEANWTVQEAQELVQLGLWSYEMAAEVLVWSVGLHRLAQVAESTVPTVELVRTLLTNDDFEKLMFCELASGERKVVDVRMQTKTGDRHLRITAMMIGHDGARQLRGAVIDITDAVRLRDQERKAEKLRMLSTLAGGLAHDLGNQMMVIAHGLDELAGDDERGRELRDSVTAASMLTSRLVSLAREGELRMMPTDVNKLVSAAVRGIQGLVRTEIEVKLDLAAELPLVDCDQRRISDAVLNLAKNACEAAGQDGTVVVATALVRRAGGRFICLSVDDSGPGIPAMTRGRIFEPFFTTKAGKSGTGLGLWMASATMAAHGGEAVVGDSSIGGARLELLLPVGDQSGEAVSECATKVDPTTILVVDDQAPVGRVVARLLRREGHMVHVTTNAVAAREAMKANGDIRLVICDLDLGDGNGHEWASHLTEHAPGLAVLYMSGFQTRQRVDGHFLPKPFTADALRFAVAAALQTDG